MSTELKIPRIKEALLQEKTGGKVRCLTCERYCQIAESELGFCQTRKNIEGKLYTLVYGDISSWSVNPIEKKPLFHFWPGSLALTVGTWSCNFACPWCQNHDISKRPEMLGRGEWISPEDFMQLMKQYRCQGTSISFNEPTLLFEYSLRVFALAKKEGYYNTFVTNGYMTAQALKILIEEGLDAMNIDIKGDKDAVSRYCQVNIQKVWRNARLAKENKVWLELTTLVIPGVNDDEKCLRGIAGRIKNELGEDTPWHVSGYYPVYRFASKVYVPATSAKALEKAREIGREEGLNYVYVGNLPGHPFENTYCPDCQKLLIKRYGFSISRYNIKDGKCPNCGKEIPIIGHQVAL
jgi:pyruvate formate lyase activating enzyme